MSVIVELPRTWVAGLERRLVTATSQTPSPFTGTVEVQDWGGEWWEYEIEFAAQSGPLARAVSAALTALGSGRGLLLFADPSITPKSLAQPITLATAVSGGNVVQSQGWPPGRPALASGDFISIGTARETRLHQIAFDARADSTGVATLTLFPALRRALPANTQLEVNHPQVLLRPTSAVPTRIERVARHRFTLSAREAL
ncbi:MAG: hypothetical protein RI538_11980 [Salibaculum sp.]|uniref:hypothetical protein n=1 Tax=Salibaculum sp. TaxID=2855480 RepID=UPI00286FC407|nr:hypothetical protein [Salibaculum sp.]MDR9483477.1 hypothetical protein [Salibaculum sp.]